MLFSAAPNFCSGSILLLPILPRKRVFVNDFLFCTNVDSFILFDSTTLVNVRVLESIGWTWFVFLSCVSGDSQHHSLDWVAMPSSPPISAVDSVRFVVESLLPSLLSMFWFLLLLIFLFLVSCDSHKVNRHLCILQYSH